MITIILGDVHLGASTSIGKAGIGSALNSRIVDQMNILDWVLDRADFHGAQQIIITGDIFEDPNPPTYLVTLFISWLMKCQAHNVAVHIIVGNHDILRTGNFYYSPLDIITESNIDNIYVYKDIDTIFVDNFAYTFLPFRDRKSFGASTNTEALKIFQSLLDYEIASIPVTYKKVLVGHFAIENSIPIGDEIDDITNELFCPLSMFSSYNYVWMGHVHKPQVMQNGSADTPHVAHIGSMDVSNFGETTQEKHIILIDQSSEQHFYKEKIPVRNLKKVNIIVPSDVVDTTEYVLKQIENLSFKENFNKSIVKIDVVLSAPELKSVDKKKVSKLLLENGVHNISTFSETKKVNLVKKNEKNAIDNSFDIPSAIKKYGEQEIDPKLKDNFMRVSMEIYKKYKAVNK